MAQAGTQAQALISENVILDFSGLFAGGQAENQAIISRTEPQNGDEDKTLTEPQKPVERLTEGLDGQRDKAPAKALIMQSQREAEDHKRTLEVYMTYQENIRKSVQLQTEILKGIKAGEDIYSLFLKAVEAIGCMTSNKLFYTQAEADIKSIYGAGLLEKQPLKLELVEVQTRLQRLTEAQEREQGLDSKQRIGAAIKAHQNRITEFESLIK